jgi:hypothetical protein
MMRDLRLDYPLDIEQLRSRLSVRRGKTIILEPSDELGGRQTFGFTWDDPAEEAVLVMYEAKTSWLHQTMIILHEFAHLILGHAGSAIDHSYRARSAADFRELSLAAVAEVLGTGSTRPRTGSRRRWRSGPSVYDERIEWEAETMATILLSWTSEGGRRTRAIPEDPFEEILSGGAG